LVLHWFGIGIPSKDFRQLLGGKPLILGKELGWIGRIVGGIPSFKTRLNRFQKKALPQEIRIGLVNSSRPKLEID